MKKESLLLAIPESQGEHAVESCQGVLLPFDERRKNDFTVRLGMELVALGLELGPKLSKVIDFSIVGQDMAMIG